MLLNFYIKQNDSSPTIRATLKGADGASLNLSGATVSFFMKRDSGDTVIQGAADLFDPSQGIVQYEWVSGDTAIAGSYGAEFEITYADGKVETFPNSGKIQVNITPKLS